MKIKVGIIGTGTKTGISVPHLKGYLKSPDAELCGVYDVNQQGARDWVMGQGIPDVEVYETLEGLFDAVDAVSICTPNFTHVPLIFKALEKKKHVLCEKPIGVPGDDLLALKEACEKSDTVTMVDFNYRLIPGFRMIKSLIEKDEIGKIYLYRHTMGGDRIANDSLPFEWRMDKKMSGSGALGDFGSHMLDMCEFLTGTSTDQIENWSLLRNIFITSRPYKEGKHNVENDDCAVFQGKTPSGALVTFTASRVGAVGNQLEIVASGAVVIFNSEEPTKIMIKRRREGMCFEPGFTSYSDDKLITNKEWLGNLPAPMLACIENTMNFIACIRDNVKPPTGIVQGIHIQQVLDSIEAKEN